MNNLNPMEDMKLIDTDGVVVQDEKASDIYESLIVIRILLSLHCIAMILMMLYIEFEQFIQSGLKQYLEDTWNKFDLINIVINLTYIYLNFAAHQERSEGITLHRRQDIRTVGAVGMFLMWIKMFYWMKLFEGPAYFITQINEVMISIGGFSQMYLIVLLAFANLFANI